MMIHFVVGLVGLRFAAKNNVASRSLKLSTLVTSLILMGKENDYYSMSISAFRPFVFKSFHLLFAESF